MWQGKDSKRTFLLQAQFIYLHPPPHSLLCSFSPSLPRFQALSLVTMERVFFRGGGCRGNSSSLTLLWEESRFFWHQWVGGRDGGWCGIGRGIDRRHLLWKAMFSSTLQQSYSRPTPAAAAGLTPTFITSEKAIACAPTYTKSTQLLWALSKRSKCVGIKLRVASGITGSRICRDWNLLLPYVPDILRSEASPHISAGVFVERLGNSVQLLDV